MEEKKERGGKKMLFNWVDEGKTPGFLKRDRMMAVVKSLSISTQRQIQIITGWTPSSVENQLKAIRNMGSKQERDQWLQSWQMYRRGPFVYALGEKGLQYIEELKNEFNPHREYFPARAQARHFVGVNEVLVRAILAGHRPLIWYNQSDTMSQLWYKLMPYKSPVRPDATIKLEGGPTCFVEFDTGTESGGKVEDKMHRYLHLVNILETIKMPMYPVVWVTFKESRRAFLQRKWEEAVSSYVRKRSIKEKPVTLPANLPQMVFFVEGQETRFLAGQTDAKSMAI